MFCDVLDRAGMKILGKGSGGRGLGNTEKCVREKVSGPGTTREGRTESHKRNVCEEDAKMKENIPMSDREKVRNIVKESFRLRERG